MTNFVPISAKNYIVMIFNIPINHIFIASVSEIKKPKNRCAPISSAVRLKPFASRDNKKTIGKETRIFEIFCFISSISL